MRMISSFPSTSPFGPLPADLVDRPRPVPGPRQAPRPAPRPFPYPRPSTAAFRPCGGCGRVFCTCPRKGWGVVDVAELVTLAGPAQRGGTSRPSDKPSADKRVDTYFGIGKGGKR